MALKIAFLDIDGCLNSGRSVLARVGVSDTDDFYEKEAIETIDPIAVGLVNRLCRKGDVKLVISSTHRCRYDHDFSELGDYIRQLGIKGQVISVTPLMNMTRGTEVEAWLASSRHNVSEWIIIDDGRDFFKDQLPRLVACDPSVGFSEKNYFDACQLLNISESTLILPEGTV